MISGIFFMILSIAFAIIVIFWAKSLENYNEYDYSELTYKEYTVVNVKRTTGKSKHYEISVDNENRPLLISSISYGAVNKENADVLAGQKIRCYVTEATNDKYSYEIVEIKTENDCILSLEDYNKKDLSNQKIGCWVVGIVSVIFMGLSIWSLVCIYGKTRVVSYNIKP